MVDKTYNDGSLLEKLLEIQEAKALNDYQFAAFLGIDNSSWSLIKRGKRNPNVETLQRILKAFPELEAIVIQYITSIKQSE